MHWKSVGNDSIFIFPAIKVHFQCNATYHENLYFCISGSSCEIDISVCNTTEKRCSNGGQCIEALGDDFFCFCPSGQFHILHAI